jgi:transcriptional regulator with GAF, ATPase, and Fis domain
MTTKEADRFHIMKLVEEKRITMKNAAKQLMLSLRQTIRLCKRYRMEGQKGII